MIDYLNAIRVDNRNISVSYTHLDVYKRQEVKSCLPTREYLSTFFSPKFLKRS